MTTPRKPLITAEEYQADLIRAFGPELAAISGLPYEDRILAMDRIDRLQGESPSDRAWPTERGNDPVPEPGWDSSGTYRPEVVRQVYEELVRAGKIGKL